MAQAYHWPFDKILAMTEPQIILVNWASQVNYRRMEESSERRRKREEVNKQKQAERDQKDPIVPEFGKRISELSTDELMSYHNKKAKALRDELRRG